MARILVVEDEKDLRQVLEYNLRQAGHEVLLAEDGRAGLELARARRPDLILLDLMLPGLSGTEICRAVRSDPATRALPIIMLTAKSEEIDRVVGFELGADDYVVKPFSVRELMLRIDAVLRRGRTVLETPAQVEFGRLRIDRDAHRVWVDGAEITLTALELKLLLTLYDRRDRVQSRSTLLDDVWGVDGDITTRTVDTHVKRLREKLGTAGDYVETVRGVGLPVRGVARNLVVTVGIRTKLFLVSLGVLGTSVVGADLYLSRALDRDLTSRIHEDLMVRLALVEREASSTSLGLDDLPAWDSMADELGRRARGRVTIVRTDGVVIGDSEVETAALATVENHATRPEIAAAQAQGTGESTRWSATVRTRMMYTAVPFRRDGSVAGTARLAVPLADVDAALGRLRRVLALASALALLIAIVMSTVAAHFTSRALRELTGWALRMARGDLKVRTPVEGHDEVAELGRAFNQISEGLSQTLEELRTERDVQARILEGMQEGVLVLDRERRVVLVNPALRAMLLLGADVVGRSLLEVIRNAELTAILDRASQDRGSASGEIEVAGLKPRRLLVHAAPLSGEPAGLLAVLVDVTDMRRLESLRKDFVANASHELRTPVTAVRSASETLRGAAAKDPAAAEHFIDIIDRNAARLQELVDDLLELSRIEGRELRPQLEPLDVGAMTTRVLDLCRERAEKRRLRLVSTLSAETPRVLADHRALERVLTNLIDNAVKYASEGASITMAATVHDRFLRITIEDTGPGIDARHLPRLFERFYRVDPGRSREMGGTGLGLSIVKHLVEAIGGTVGVESIPGKGSIFGFTLPIAPATVSG